MNKVYAAIDLKSFYASVECIHRGLDPMTTNLVVADSSRTDKTICLAVTPSLKKFGVPGRPRLFEVVQKVGEANALRQMGDFLRMLQVEAVNYGMRVALLPLRRSAVDLMHYVSEATLISAMLQLQMTPKATPFLTRW